jgi:hypothetical protein
MRADMVETFPDLKVNCLLQSEVTPPMLTVQSTLRTPFPPFTPFWVTVMDTVSSP